MIFFSEALASPGDPDCDVFCSYSMFSDKADEFKNKADDNVDLEALASPGAAHSNGVCGFSKDSDDTKNKSDDNVSLEALAPPGAPDCYCFYESFEGDPKNE